MKYFTFIFSVLLLTSCSDIKKGKQIETIEVLDKTVDSINTVLLENKYDELEPLFTEAKAVETKIRDNYSTDTIGIDFAEKLDAYKNMINSFEPLKNAYSKLLKGTAEEKSTLLKLKNDIENGNGERVRYEEFVVFENKKTQQLRILLSEYINQRKKTMDTYQALHTVIYDYSFSLIAK